MRLFIGEQRRLLHDEGTPPQGRLLVMLLQRGTLKQAEFGRLLGLEKSWVSRSVDKLVEQGWVARSTLASDRRNVQLQLTAAGKVAARKVDARMSAHASEVLDRLPVAKRQRVVSALKELCVALQRPSLSPIDTADQTLQDKTS
jgi:DNA-binding MarR family transcriptional regulator